MRKVDLEHLEIAYDDAEPAGYRAGAAHLGPLLVRRESAVDYDGEV